MKAKGFLSTFLSVFLSVLTLFSFAGCGKEEKKVNWWQDWMNLTYEISDERSTSSTQRFQPNQYSANKNNGDIEFIYNLSEWDGERELLPTFKVYYKDVEQDVYVYIYKRLDINEEFPNNLYKKIEKLDSEGKYSVKYDVYLSEEGKRTDPVGTLVVSRVILVTIEAGQEKGEEQ